jgi:hypothetical protein
VITAWGFLAFLLLNQDRPLATLPDDASEIVINADATSVAWIEGGRSVVLDGKPGPKFGAVRSLTISRTGASIAYAAKVDGGWVVLSGATRSACYDEVGPPLVEGKGVAFAARKGSAWVVVVNGVEGPEFDGVESLALSPDGTHAAYAGRRGDKATLMLDKDRGPEFDQVKALRFYAEGKRLSYAAVRGTSAWIVEGMVTPESPAIAIFREPGATKASVLVGLFDVSDPARLRSHVEALLSEGQTVSLEVDASVPWKEVLPLLKRCKEAGCARVEFGVPSPKDPFETFDSLTALAGAPDGKFAGAIGVQNGLLRVFYGGKQSVEYKAIAGLVAGPNRTFAFRVDDGEGWCVVKGIRGRKGKAYKAVEGPVLSPDGKQVAYAAGDGQSWRIVLEETQSEGYDQVWLPQFIDGSGGVVFAARKGRAILRKALPGN